MGCPIRTPRDQRPLAASPGFSQRATSFIASWRQGIHPMPFSCSSRARARSHTHAGASQKPRHAQKPSTAQNPGQQTIPVPRQSPRSAHTQKRFEHCSSFGLEARSRLRKPPPPGQTPRPNPPRTTPASPAKPLARSRKTHRSVLRAQNAPEPDSQSIKNTRPSSPKRQTPPNGGGPAPETQTFSP